MTVNILFMKNFDIYHLIFDAFTHNFFFSSSGSSTYVAEERSCQLLDLVYAGSEQRQMIYLSMMKSNDSSSMYMYAKACSTTSTSQSIIKQKQNPYMPLLYVCI